MNRLILSLSMAAFLLVGLPLVANADPITIHFTNNEVDLGTATQINLTTQYLGFGLLFTDVYRYIDGRDTFSHAPNQVNCQNLGISNGRIEDIGRVGATGRVDFVDPTDFITFDWWTITGVFQLEAFNSSGGLVGTFSGSGQGTNTIQ